MDAQAALMNYVLIAVSFFYVVILLLLFRWWRVAGAPGKWTFVKPFFGMLILFALLCALCLTYLRESIWVVFLSGIFGVLLTFSLLAIGAFGALRLVAERASATVKARLYAGAFLLWLAMPIYFGAKVYLGFAARNSEIASLAAQVKELRQECIKGSGDTCMLAFEKLMKLSSLGDYDAYHEARRFLDLACDRGRGDACSDFVFRNGLSGEKAGKYFAKGCKLGNVSSCLSLANESKNRKKALAVFRKYCDQKVEEACERIKNEPAS